jgi:hypothetical protein
MAALIFEHARIAREQAQLARSDSMATRRRARQCARVAHARRAKAVKAAAEARRSNMPLPSPWSGLEWLREDEQLGRVLVPID